MTREQAAEVLGAVVLREALKAVGEDPDDPAVMNAVDLAIKSYVEELAKLSAPLTPSASLHLH